MQLLLDIGNSSTTAALAGKRVHRPHNLPTRHWSDGRMPRLLELVLGQRRTHKAVICSVVPKAARAAEAWLNKADIPHMQFNHKTCGIGIDYPKPSTIGPDRLANARAALEEFGAPVVIVDFGTAVTFDIVNRHGHYAGGIIAPGLAAMTDYLHEKTALLPRITLRAPRSAIGRNSEEAMRIGAVHGYQGLVEALIRRVQKELRTKKLPVIATGGHAKLIAEKIEAVTAIRPKLTLEGLRLATRPAN
ncbi:MAG: type III pantothenate kinase [Verrucomicrobiales bacterium]|nr:type III pantothenate kinase [Verrucomicrobiales bacterium]|tara:strand:- start:95 stop:835 length:741 start_codon:yes stop_codon:yes gene_type:complete